MVYLHVVLHPPTISTHSASHCPTRNASLVRVGHFTWLSGALLLHLRGRNCLENPAAEAVCMGGAIQVECMGSAAAAFAFSFPLAPIFLCK